jgi:hypothetical protein
VAGSRGRCTRTEQREDGDGSHRVVQQAGAIGEGLQVEAQRAFVPGPRDDVGERPATLAAMLRVEHLLHAVDAAAVDRDEHVTRADAGARARSIAADVGRHDALGTRLPQDAVLDLDPREADRDVGADQREEDRRDEHGEGGAAPLHAPRPLWGCWPDTLGHRLCVDEVLAWAAGRVDSP